MAMFGSQAAPRPSTTQLILGSLGDALTNLTGGQGMFLPQLMRQQQMAQQEQQYQRRRSDENADWLMRQNWERANPAPRAPHYFEANNGDQYTIGSDGQPQLVYHDPTPKVQMVAVDNGDGTKTIVPFSNGVPLGQGAGTQGAPQRPVGKLTPYKPGGATPSASRTFP